MTPTQRKKKLAELRAMLAIESRRHQAKVQRLSNAIRKLQIECDHANQKRYADPSGGHDHAYECLTCGMAW